MKPPDPRRKRRALREPRAAPRRVLAYCRVARYEQLEADAAQNNHWRSFTRIEELEREAA